MTRSLSRSMISATGRSTPAPCRIRAESSSPLPTSRSPSSWVHVPPKEPTRASSATIQ